MKRSFALLISAAFLLLNGQQVDATVIGGGVTSGSGSFVKLSIPFTESDPDNTVGANTFQSPNLFAFDEDQNINISSEVQVNVGTNPQAGDVVASHYVFFDPTSGSQTGFVDFDAPIFGVATSTANLANSDFLANTGVNYLNPTLRGLESGDSVSIDPTNAARLLVDWTASSPGDYVRVLTQRSPLADNPIPNPATLIFFVFGLTFLAFGSRAISLQR